MFNGRHTLLFKVSLLFAFVVVVIFGVRIFTVRAVDSWYNTSWSYRAKITVNSSQVPSTQSYFPVYVDLSTLPAGFFSHVKSDGSDIRITNSAGTELPREVVVINTGASTGELWFQANSISDGSHYYIYYGNAGASEPSPSSTYGSQHVWDDGGTTNYLGIWHMPNGSSLTGGDSSSNGKTMTITGPDPIAGKLDGGGSFVVANNDYMITPSLGATSGNSITEEAWIKPNAAGGVVFAELGQSGINSGWHDVHLEVETNNTIKACMWTGAETCVTAGSGITYGQWYHVVMRYNTVGPELTGFVNGVKGATSGLTKQYPGALYYGVGSIDSTTPGNGVYFSGLIDEARVSKSLRSDNWIATEFNNQSAPSTFYSISSEQFVGSNIPPVMSSSNYMVQSDSINFAGGLSTSANYTMQDTLGEIATGYSSSTNYKMSAGYQQMLQSYISITVTGNPTLPNMSGISGGFGNASTTWLVTTDNPAGYALSINATGTPALQGLTNGDSIADYVPAGAVPDYDFAILPTQSLFGFNPLSADITSRYKNNGVNTCGTGTNNTLYKCWDGLSTTPKIISQGATANQPNGATTTAVYQIQIGSSKIQTSGRYAATITVTAVTL